MFYLTSDEEAPVYVGCPFNVSSPNDFGVASAVVNWTDPAVSDNTVAVTSTPDTPSGSSFNLGPSVVTYSAQDAYGNTATCLVYVTVYGELMVHLPSFFRLPGPCFIKLVSTNKLQ